MSRKKNNHENTNFNYLKDDWEESASCIHLSHQISQFDRRAWRTKSGKACVRCLAKISEGRCSFDINEIAKPFRQIALDFWSDVEILEPDECWNWKGERDSKGRGIVRWKRPFSYSNKIPPSRAAFWLAWGDIGTGFSVSRECGNPECANPLHLRGVGCGHLLMPQSLEKFNLVFSARALRQASLEYGKAKLQELKPKARTKSLRSPSLDLWSGDGTIEGLQD